MITDAAGTPKSESDYYPWGGELQFANGDPNHYKFTGKERDAETGPDYFGARHYSNGLGRFITPDWAAKATAVPYADFADLQSLNLYTYVRNIPTTKYDVDGHEVYGQVDVDLSRPARALIAVAEFIKWFPHTGPPKGQPEPAPWCQCMPLPSGNNKNANNNKKNDNNSNQSSTNNQSGQGKSKTNGVDQDTKDNVKNNAGGKCEYCGKKTTTTADTASGRAPAGDEGQTDHYKPRSKGGTDDESNLVHACRDCNGSGGKGNADPTNPNGTAGQKWRLPRMEKQPQQK